MSNEIEAMGLTGPDQMYLKEKQAQVMMQAQDNPFNNPQYQHVTTPDTPIMYGGGMAEVLLSNKEVPQILRDKYWWIFNNDNILTFLDENRKHSKMLALDIAMIDAMNSMSSYDDFTFDTELQQGLMRNAFDTRLDRSVGFKGGNIKNERVILQSQFTESRAINEDGNMGNVREGFFKRLLGRR